MNQRNLRTRQRTVTKEPFALAETLQGRELATVRRRGAAMAVDVVIWALVSMPLVAAILYTAMYLQTPTLARVMRDIAVGRGAGDSSTGVAEILALVERRRPGALPNHLAEPAAAGDLEKLAELLKDEAFGVSATFDAEPSHFDTRQNVLHVNRDVIFGRLSPMVSFAAIGIVLSSLVTWLSSGRSPGKWLFAIRTVKLDGTPLTFADAFSRAGGYTASLSTLGMGFVSALRDPNRQALHDRVARTVVIRDHGRAGLVVRLWQRLRPGTPDQDP